MYDFLVIPLGFFWGGAGVTGQPGVLQCSYMIAISNFEVSKGGLIGQVLAYYIVE